MKVALNIITTYFPIWAILASIASLIEPEWFTWFSGDWIIYGLGLVMLGMGITIKKSDFQVIAQKPWWIFIGLLLQFTIMPFLGWSIGILFHLPTAWAIGLVLVSCCPGGTASNVITYLAKGNLALSVGMTTVSTFGAIFLTPILTLFLAGGRVDVDAFGLFLTTLKVVLIPVLVGIGINWKLKNTSKKLQVFSPSIAVLIIILIVASIIGKQRELILNSGLQLIGAVILLHSIGFFVAYILAKRLTKDEQSSRTISIEVGMQNSGLGAVLAQKHFAASPATAVPAALSSITHCIIGSILASIWRKKK